MESGDCGQVGETEPGLAGRRGFAAGNHTACRPRRANLTRVKAQLLCIGDLHLGRRPTHLPPDEAQLDATDLGPEAALRECVKRAIELEADAVLLAGDVVERLEDRFAAFGALQDAVSELTELGIPVVGVTGNHDTEALPRLAERIPAFRLLGRGGRWESFDLQRDGSPLLRIWGWSFPDTHYTLNPLEGFPGQRKKGLTEIGLLHADLDKKSSAYAPVARAALAKTGLQAWLLGHIHQPSLSGKPPIGYLGSVAAFDPGDTGPRGPWRLTLNDKGAVDLEHLPFAPLRYENVELDVSELGASDAAGYEDVLHDLLFKRGLERTAAKLENQTKDTRAVCVRVHLVGRTSSRLALSRAITSLTGRAGGLPSLRSGRAFYYVDQIVDRARAARDLDVLARDTSYPGLIAKRILSLEALDAEGQRMVERAAEEIPRRMGLSNRNSLGIDLEPVEPEELQRSLIEAAHEALERVLAQGQELDGGF